MVRPAFETGMALSRIATVAGLLLILVAYGCGTAVVPAARSDDAGPSAAAGTSEASSGSQTARSQADGQSDSRTLAWSPQARAVSAWPLQRAWANWRGPGTLSIAWHAELPDKWPEQLKPDWQVELGTGWSSPVVGEGRVFITDRQGDVERVLAVDAQTGSILWRCTNAVDFEPHAVGRRHGNGPKATPVVDSGHVYSLGIAGWLQCIDARTGKRLWHVHLPARYGRLQPLPGGRAYVNGEQNVVVPVGQKLGAPVPLFGYTGSPTVDGQRLIVQVGGARGATVMALDKQTGAELWRALDDHVSYSSPVVAELAGVRQVIVMTGSRVVGLRIDNGQLLWEHPFQIQYDESISTPTVAGDLVLVTGDSRPLTALRITREGDRWRKQLAWENDDLSSYLSSMVATGDYVFGMNDDGQLACVRLRDGQTLWSGGNHGYYCSPVAVGDKLLGLNEAGELLVLQAATDAYRPLALVQLTDEPTWTVPAMVGRRVFVRSRSMLQGFTWPRQP